MKILMVAPTPFFADRGAHTQIYEQINALQGLGHEIILCTYGLGRDVEGVRTSRIWNPPWYSKLSAGPSVTKILLLPILFFKTFLVSIKFKPDFIHGHLHEGALIALLLKRLTGISVISDLQGSLKGELRQHTRIASGKIISLLINKFEVWIVSNIDIVTQSDSMVDEFRVLSNKPNLILNIRDGVDTNRFKPAVGHSELFNKYGIKQEFPRFIFMGLLEQYQGVDLLIEAFSKANKVIPKAQLIIIGYPNIDRYRELALQFGCAGQVKFLGRANYFEVQNLLSLGTIAVAPKISVTEGDGKIYNYMAMGLPTITFDRPVSREILSDTAVYCDFADVDSLANAMISLASDAELQKHLGELARSRAVEFLSWQKVASRITEAYLAIQEKR